MLDEPARSPYDLNFLLFGIPVRVHPWFWLAGLILGPLKAGPIEIAVWMAAFFFGILCHELGHALVMRSQGYVPRITLYGLGGMASYDPSRVYAARAGHWRQIAISAAGPFAGFLLAAAVIGLVLASGHKVKLFVGAPYGLLAGTPDVIWRPYLAEFINHFLFVTIVYGILNLLPIYPLDGGKIAREALVMCFRNDGVRQSLILSMLVAGGLAALAAVQWKQFFLAIFFGALAYASYVNLRPNAGRRGW